MLTGNTLVIFGFAVAAVIGALQTTGWRSIVCWALAVSFVVWALAGAGHLPTVPSFEGITGFVMALIAPVTVGIVTLMTHELRTRGNAPGVTLPDIKRMVEAAVIERMPRPPNLPDVGAIVKAEVATSMAPFERALTEVEREWRHKLGRGLVESFEAWKIGFPERGKPYDVLPVNHQYLNRAIRAADEELAKLGSKKTIAAVMEEAERQVHANAIYCVIGKDDAERWRSPESKQQWYVHNAKIDAAIKLVREVFSMPPV